MSDRMPRTPHHSKAITCRDRTSKFEQGQGLVEYALGLVMVSMVASVALVTVGPGINNALCKAVETLNSAIDTGCATGSESELTGEDPGEDSGIQVMFAKYDAKKEELDIQAKAPKDCPYDLQVAGMGTMTRQGESYVFKYSEKLSPPPSTVQVGHPGCGWSTVPVGG